MFNSSVIMIFSNRGWVNHLQNLVPKIGSNTNKASIVNFLYYTDIHVRSEKGEQFLYWNSVSIFNRDFPYLEKLIKNNIPEDEYLILKQIQDTKIGLGKFYDHQFPKIEINNIPNHLADLGEFTSVDRDDFTHCFPFNLIDFNKQ